jgi:hypothetical protein
VVLGTTVAAIAVAPRAAGAEGASPLVLPLLAALAIAQQAADTAREANENPIEARVDKPAKPAPSFRSRLPGQLKIPDVYKVDFHRDARRWAEPIDATNFLALDLWPAPLAGVTPLVSYDRESRFIGDSSDILRFELEIRW